MQQKNRHQGTGSSFAQGFNEGYSSRQDRGQNYRRDMQDSRYSSQHREDMDPSYHPSEFGRSDRSDRMNYDTRHAYEANRFDRSDRNFSQSQPSRSQWDDGMGRSESWSGGPAWNQHQDSWSQPSRDLSGRYSQDYVGRYEGRFAGKGPKGYRRSDERIREDVCEALEHHAGIDASEIEVAVKDGIVTLSGTIESRQMKRLAEECAESLRGIQDVKNELRVDTTAVKQQHLGSDIESTEGSTRTNLNGKSQAGRSASSSTTGTTTSATRQ